MADTLTLHFGSGNKGAFSVEQLLNAVKADKKYFDAVGNGLRIGGVNASSLDKVFRLPEETTVLKIVAPELDPIELNTVCDLPERTPEEEAEVQARRSGELKDQSVNEETADQG